MTHVDIHESIEVNATKDRVWAIMAEEFLSIAAWGPGISKSIANPNSEKKFEDAVTGGRICTVSGFGEVYEDIIAHDKEAGKIGWSAAPEKVPGFVKHIQNIFTIEEIDENKVKVSSHLEVDLSGVMGKIMKGTIRKNFGKFLPGFLRDLGIYAETGVPRKAKKTEKAA